VCERAQPAWLAGLSLPWPNHLCPCAVGVWITLRGAGACLPACLLLCSHAAGQAKAGGKGPYGPTHPRLFGWPEQTPPPHTFASRRVVAIPFPRLITTAPAALLVCGGREYFIGRPSGRLPRPAATNVMRPTIPLLFLRAVQNETLKPKLIFGQSLVYCCKEV
jgi:hypothetical protein